MSSETPDESAASATTPARQLGSELVDALLACPSAAELHTHWTSSPTSPDAIGFVRLRDRLGQVHRDVTPAPEPPEYDAPSWPLSAEPTVIRPGQSAEVALTSLALRTDSSGGGPFVKPRASTSKSALGRSKPFSHLPASLVAQIEQQLEPRTFEPGQALMRQGEPGDGLFLITSGLVEIRTTDAAAGPHAVARVASGDIVGEMALLTEEPRTADVVAVECVETLFLPVARFDELARRHPVISRVLTRLLADRLGQADHDVLAGKTLGDHRIVRWLGRGGMAIVYQGEQLQTGERVALKMMSHRLVYDARALELFRREARIVESFDHPNIVRMKGRFRAFRSFFIVMEYCDGVSLEDTVQQRGALPMADVRPIIGQLAAALAYAHAHDVVHRDVKPSNAMLTRKGRVKLMDFGLANPVDGEVRGMVAGTPRYMAPEQLQGRPTGTAADLFSLGCLAWKLLTGRDLIDSSDVSAVQRRHEHWESPRSDCRDPEVRAFLLACLQRDPHDRTVDLERIARWSS